MYQFIAMALYFPYITWSNSTMLYLQRCKYNMVEFDQFIAMDQFIAIDQFMAINLVEFEHFINICTRS
jgi:hypothetical protein